LVVGVIVYRGDGGEGGGDANNGVISRKATPSANGLVGYRNKWVHFFGTPLPLRLELRTTYVVVKDKAKDKAKKFDKVAGLARLDDKQGGTS
jgi:hypothetical protein